MKEPTFLEATKKDGREMAELLKEVPAERKADVFLLVNAFNLGVETEKRRKRESEVNHIERSIPYSRRSIERDWNTGKNDYIHGAERSYQSGGCHSSE